MENKEGSSAIVDMPYPHAPSRKDNDLDKQMTKNTTDTSQLSQSSQHPRQGPTKLHNDLSRRRTGPRLQHHIFFLLVFVKEKFM